jgi:glycosyltransferase involved in cell wall biosynthesis
MSDSTGSRVLLVASAASLAEDAGRHVADLVRRLPDAGLAVGLACPKASELAPLAESLGIPVFAVEAAASFSPARVGAMRRALAAFAPDIVHAHGSRAAILARVADSRARERVIYHIHGIHYDQAPSAPRRAAFLRIERRLRSRTAAWITACGSDLNKADGLKMVRRERSHVVHNGVDVPPAPDGVHPRSGEFRSELGLAAVTPLVVSIGAYSEQKDHRTLIDAWAGVHDAFPDAVLVLVGSGELEGKLRVRSVALSLGDSVRFVSARRDVAPLLADADVFALSSRWEGLPYTLLDAMAFGRPVVSTAADGIPEAVMNEDTGLLVPVRDSESLAAAMRRLLREPELRSAMGASGRARVERHFTLDEMVDGVLRVYAEVIAATGDRE